MDIFWVFWGIIGIIIPCIILSLYPVVFLVMRKFVQFCWYQLSAHYYTVHLMVFGEPDNFTVRPVPIHEETVNATNKNGWSFADCPTTVWVRRKINHTLEVEFGAFQETCTWYCYPSVDFYVGMRSGRIKKLVVKYRHIRNRGQWFRHSCGTTDWAKYLTSVVLAHIECLKFNQYRRSHHPTLISHILKTYGENFFQDVV